MHKELTNLLPLARQHAVRRDYFVRLAVIMLWFVSALTLAAAVLLIPTYVFLVGSASGKEARLATINATLSSADESALSARLLALSQNAKTLTTLADVPSVSGIIREMLMIGRPGITISGLQYTPPSGKNLGAMTISGVAATRDALRKYQLALSSSSLVRTADLPVSAYAKDSDIEFTISIKLVP